MINGKLWWKFTMLFWCVGIIYVGWLINIKKIRKKTIDPKFQWKNPVINSILTIKLKLQTVANSQVINSSKNSSTNRFHKKQFQQFWVQEIATHKKHKTYFFLETTFFYPHKIKGKNYFYRILKALKFYHEKCRHIKLETMVRINLLFIVKTQTIFVPYEFSLRLTVSEQGWK